VAGKEAPMKERKIKVYKAPGLDNDLPQIRLQGKWLSDLGFNVDDQIIVSCKSDRLIIERAVPEKA